MTSDTPALGVVVPPWIYRRMENENHLCACEEELKIELQNGSEVARAAVRAYTPAVIIGVCVCVCCLEDDACGPVCLLLIAE